MERCRLAGAVGADQSEHNAGLQVQIERSQRKAGVALFEALNREGAAVGGSVHCLPPCSLPRKTRLNKVRSCSSPRPARRLSSLMGVIAVVKRSSATARLRFSGM